LHGADVRSQRRDGGVERSLAAAEDVDEGALFNEAFGGGQADAGGAAGDDGGLPVSLFMVCFPYWGEASGEMLA